MRSVSYRIPVVLANVLHLSLVCQQASLTVSQTPLPLSYEVSHRDAECLYERIAEANEHVTSSVFVTAGDELRAAVVFEGPVCPSDVESPQQMKQYADRYEKEGVAMYLDEGMVGGGGVEFARYLKPVRIQQLLDFEDEEEEADDDGEVDVEKREEELKDQVEEEAEFDDDFVKLQLEHEKNRDATKRSGGDSAQPNSSQQQQPRRRLSERISGEPWQNTVFIQSPGWYRLCVRPARATTIQVEMELRKSSLFGKVDPRTGHVPSAERVALRREMHDLYQNPNAQDPEIPEGLVKEEDLKVTRGQMRILERVYEEIIQKQLEERRMWHWRTLKNQHSHSHMVLGELFETILYMTITGLQIYTIRKWFRGGPQLGK